MPAVTGCSLASSSVSAPAVARAADSDAAPDVWTRLSTSPASGTSFVVVAAPERDALREASYFVERLGEEQMPLAGLVLNRVHSSGAASLSAARATAGAEMLEDAKEHPVTAGILRLHARRMRLVEREQSLRGRFTAAHPRVPVVDVAAQPGDVHDLDGLRLVGASLAGA